MIKGFFYKILEKSTLDRLGLLASALLTFASKFKGSAEIFGHSMNWWFIGMLLAVLLIFGLALGRIYGPEISVLAAQTYHPDSDFLRKNERIDMKTTRKSESDIVEVSLEFTVPDYQEEIYVSFETTGYSIGITQHQRVNFDDEKAITRHSDVGKFDMTLTLEPEGSSNHASEVPLKIRNKLNGRVIKRLTLAS